MKSIHGKNFQLGMLGGGQLGRMLLPEANYLDVDIHVLDPSADAPCAELAASFTLGDFRDYQTVLDFGRGKDLITIEIEDVNIDALRVLKSEGVVVCPDPEHIAIIQDKGTQKVFFDAHKLPSSPYKLIHSHRELSAADLPCALKLRTGGYDGKGVMVLRNKADLDSAFDAPCVVEQLVDIDKELAVIIARNASGETASFPVVELVFDPTANLVDYLFAPAQIAANLTHEATELALRVADAFEFTGILAVEMFLTKSGEILINEVAPRTHNSGHHTIEANYTSQFGQHLRAILNLPLGSTAPLRMAAMVNLVGEAGYSGPVHYEGMSTLLAMPGVYPHLYGKAQTKPYRKMGHVTVLADSIDDLQSKVAAVKTSIRVISK
jgi:5-(carboxyamino)imidazole ribonucleotide synthase